MKILYLNPDRGIPVLGDKGASVHVREFVTTLARQGHEVVVACANLGNGNAPPPATDLIELPFDADATQLEQECLAWGLSVKALEDRATRREVERLCYDRRLPARIKATLEARHYVPDFVYERHALFHCAGGAIVRSIGVPRIVEVNAPLIREQEQFRGLVLKAIATVSEKIAFEQADCVVAVSDVVARYVGSCGIRPDKIVTVPNGVDTANFNPRAGGEVIRERYGLSNEPVMGFIGSFKPWHGIDLLIEGFASIAARHKDVRLLCVGEGPELASARERIALGGLADRVVFTGRVAHAEVPGYLAAMDISVAPYLAQPDFYFSPLKIVESLAAGTPVIAPRVGQIERLVDDGITGFLFAPDDRGDFIEKAADLIGDPRRRRVMAEQARARAVADFSWDKAVSRVLGVARRCTGVAYA